MGGSTQWSPWLVVVQVRLSKSSMPHGRPYPMNKGLTPPAQQRGIEPRSAVLETAVLPLHHCHIHTTRRWRQGGITGVMLRFRGRESNPRTLRPYSLSAYTLLLPQCGARGSNPGACRYRHTPTTLPSAACDVHQTYHAIRSDGTMRHAAMRASRCTRRLRFRGTC